MNAFAALEDCLRSRNSAATLAFGSGGVRTVDDLQRDVARVEAALPQTMAGSQLLLVFQNDRYHFAVAMLACWRAGHSIALPPNTRRDAVLELSQRPDVCGVLHDLATPSAIRVPDLLNDDSRTTRSSKNAVEFWDFSAMQSRPIAATVFTSGTTAGVNTACPKSAQQLIGEARSLRTTFGVAPDARIVTTAQPGHIYGLLYTVLMPLLAGAAFIRETPFYPDSVAAAVRSAEASVLVTVPAHIRTLLAVEAEDFASLSHVFSSTAPLPTELAADFKTRFGIPIVEVLGSSETGGIASRHAPDERAWRPLFGAGVRADDEGRLCVTSPFASPQGDEEVRTADLVEMQDDGTFLHLGRADGVLKIGGHRVSLPAMERAVSRIPGVDDVALTSIKVGGAREHAIFAAVTGDKIEAAAIHDVLRTHYQESCLPRRILVVKQLPREDNGKISRPRLLRLFGYNAQGEALSWKLDWDTTAQPAPPFTHSFALHVPQTYAWFEGHFPGYPVLAAAVQLTEIVRPALERVLGEPASVQRVNKMKFTGRILPGDHLQLNLDASKPGRVAFRIEKDGEVCSSGEVLTVPNPDTRQANGQHPGT